MLMYKIDNNIIWKEIVELNKDEYISTIAELSKPNEDSEPLISSEKSAYNFDKISKKFNLSKHGQAASADALEITENEIILTEFKTGFNRLVFPSRERKGFICSKDKAYIICDPYRILRKKYNDAYINNLNYNLKLKIVESFVTLSYLVPSLNSYKLKFWVVINNPIDEEEDILRELGKKPISDNNIISKVKNMMSRFRKCESRDYYYDEVKVFTANEYIKKINS